MASWSITELMRTTIEYIQSDMCHNTFYLGKENPDEISNMTKTTLIELAEDTLNSSNIQSMNQFLNKMPFGPSPEPGSNDWIDFSQPPLQVQTGTQRIGLNAMYWSKMNN